jgi:transcriptional regulator with XRE-family HTH domain
MRRLMEDRGWSITKTAKQCGVSAGTIGNLLAGRTTQPHPKTVHALATGFGVTAGEIRGQLPMLDDDRHAELIRACAPLSARQLRAVVQLIKTMNGTQPVSRTRTRR